ncbi:hypothetical protein EV361DRAFT_870518 [Lentinula raphanica]|nr:hypothetical protein EV361DRAFT_870518 [Lentinula raphanica]
MRRKLKNLENLNAKGGTHAKPNTKRTSLRKQKAKEAQEMELEDKENSSPGPSKKFKPDITSVNPTPSSILQDDSNHCLPSSSRLSPCPTHCLTPELPSELSSSSLLDSLDPVQLHTVMEPNFHENILPPHSTHCLTLSTCFLTPKLPSELSSSSSLNPFDPNQLRTVTEPNFHEIIQPSFSLVTGHEPELLESETNPLWNSDEEGIYESAAAHTESGLSEPEELEVGISSGIPWDERKPPTVVKAVDALDQIRQLLHPQSGPNDKTKRTKDASLKGWTPTQLHEIKQMLNLYTNPNSSTYSQWTESSLQVVIGSARRFRSGTYAARMLRSWTKEYILSRKIPVSTYGTWAQSKLETYPELAEDLKAYLVGIGKYVKAQGDIITFLNQPDIKETYHIKETIHLSTAKRWMNDLQFRWVLNHKGQYVDGHERDDVVKYRQNVFLPAWYSIESHMRSWNGENMDELQESTDSTGHRVVVWFHNESIFYANDRRTACWVFEAASPTPYAKGEGVSLMVADFVSADYGWLRSKDGLESARVIWKPGKNRDGYFTHEDILAQLEKAVEILKRDYPDEEHIFVYDNAPTHLKRAEDALSARKMPRNPPRDGKNWGVEVTVRDESGRVTYDNRGKPCKTKIKMAHGSFRDGTPQDFYFGANSETPGIFKGMALILEER